MKSEILNHDANSDSKMDDNQIRLKAITLSINDNFPSLKLHFIVAISVMTTQAFRR